MNLEKIKDNIETRIENYITVRKFNSLMPIGNEPNFWVFVQGKNLTISGYNSSDIVFKEIKSRVATGSKLIITVDLGSREENLNYTKI